MPVTCVCPGHEAGSAYNPEKALATDLGSMRATSKGCDVTIIAGDGKEFPVHSLVLASRSDVFATMLYTEMVEGKTKRVEVKDVNDETMTLFLKLVLLVRIFKECK